MSADCLYYKCLTTTQTEIRNLNLSGVASSSVHILSAADDQPSSIAGPDRKIAYPFILIVPYGSESLEGEESQTDDIVYPVLVGMIDNVNQNQSTNLARNLYWRQRLISKFHYNTFSSINSQNESTVRPLTAVDPAAFRDKNRWVSGLLINYKVTVGRGR